MKNIFNKFAFFIVLSFVFISCGNLTTSENDDSIPQGKGKITISTDLQNGRSVLPTAITKDTTGLKWELTGIKDGTLQTIKYWTDFTDEVETVTAYKSMTSDLGIVIDTGTWDFTLTASNTDGKNVLSATISTTINAGENKLNFVMQEATVNAASGSIEFTLNFPKDVVGNVVAKLFKYENNDNEISTSTLSIDSSSTDNCSFVKYSYPDATGTTSSPLSAGYYILKIQLQQSVNNQNMPINTYSCLIRVAPGLTSYGVYTLDKLAQLYTIKYECGQGSIENQLITTSYNAYTSFELPEPTYQGYYFAGWYTQEYADDGSIKETLFGNAGETKTISEDITLYAKWNKEVTGITHANNTLYISDYEGLCIFRDIVNGSHTDGITIPAKESISGASAFVCDAGTSYNYLSVELENDIKVTDAWIPIGVYSSTPSESRDYNATFDGNNHTITLSNGIDSTSYAALFVNVKGTIKNLVVEGNIKSEGSNVVAGICAYSNGGTFEHCVNKCKINSNTSSGTGGIVGYSNGATIKSCVNMGEISSSLSTIGGIVGATTYSSTVTIENSINLGKITGTSNVSGIFGLGGSSASVQNITDCINIGEIAVTPSDDDYWTYAAGIICSSDSVTVSNCISVGNIINNTSAFGGNAFFGAINYSSDKGTYSNCYYDSSKIINPGDFNVSEINSKTTSELCSLDSSILSNWSKDVSRYPLPNIVATDSSEGISELVWNEICELAKVDTSSSGGSGTATGITYGGTDSTGVPIFYVYSAEGLATFRNIVNGTLLDDTLTSYTISADSSVPEIADYSITNQEAITNISGVLQADIDLSGIEWIPIGTEDSPFEGSFDGQNKTISNLTISNATTENQGLFGVFDCSLSDEKRCLSNICVTGSITTSSPYAGGLVGQATNIVFQNCENYIEINSSSETVGGFVGQADTCDFIGCTNYADIISTSSSSYNLCVGGIAGLITDVTAEYCYNAGNISANMSVGGIFGFEQSSSISNPTIEYCVNTGVITGSSYYGGIVGYASKALSLGYCANYGEITYSGNDDNPENGFILGGCSSSNITLATEILSVGKSSSNGAAPTNPTYYAVSKNASVTSSYYDSDKLTDIQGLSSNVGGDALSTSELINGTTLDNFASGDWNYQTGRYPIPNLKDNISAVAWDLLVSTVSEQ